MESLNASCGIQEVLVMSQASYGLMRVGRCVTSAAVETGCGADVLHLADRWCSGRKDCSVQVPNKDLVQASTGLCSELYAQYLEVDYHCIPGMQHIGNQGSYSEILTCPASFLLLAV